jgi:hypothetical protein
MKSKVYTSPLAKRILLALGLVVLPLSVASQTQAKGPASIPGKPTIAVVYIGDHPGMNIKNAAELKARLLYLIAHNPKSVKALSKGCGCAAVAPDDLAGFGSCMRGCLADVGVSAVSVIMCGASCAAAGTGLGAIVCAVCVGVDVTVVVVCAMGCAAYPKGFGMIMDANNSGPHPDPGLKRARRTVKTAGAHSLDWSSI